MGYGAYSRRALGGANRVSFADKPKQKKTVFGTHHNTAHIWAQQTQAYGRASDGRLWFNGSTIYSYGKHFPIAAFQSERFDGKQVVLFTTDKYGPTTAGHCSLVRSALRGLDVHMMDVADVLPVGTQDRDTAHKFNLEKILADLDTLAASYAKPNKQAWLWLPDVGRLDDTAENRCLDLYARTRPIIAYCDAFNIADPPVAELTEHIEAKCAAIRTAFARYNDPAKVAKREKDANKRQLKYAAAMSRYHGWREGVCELPPTDKLPAHIRKLIERERWQARFQQQRERLTPEQWIEGKGQSSQLNSYDAATLVRRVADRLETSRGAVVPWQHAVVAFFKAQRCRRHHEKFERNGEQVPVGHYRIDAIDTEGNLHAGCHTIAWPEMLRLAIREIPQDVKPTFPVPVCF